MAFRNITRTIGCFIRNSSGEFAMQSALMFGALAVVGALLAVPLLDRATREYAQNRSYGIDPVTTASTPKPQGQGNTYIVRRSVLSDNEVIICRSPSGKKC